MVMKIADPNVAAAFNVFPPVIRKKLIFLTLTIKFQFVNLDIVLQWRSLTI